MTGRTTVDLPAVNELTRQLLPTRLPLGFAALRRLLADRNLTLLAARDGACTVGIGALVMIATPAGVRARIEDVVVDERYRSRGLGERLVAGLVDTARRRGASHIELSSHARRVAANRLYRKLGFTRRDTNVYTLALRPRAARPRHA